MNPMTLRVAVVFDESDELRVAVVFDDIDVAIVFCN